MSPLHLTGKTDILTFQYVDFVRFWYTWAALGSDIARQHRWLRRVPSGHIRFRRVSVGTLFWPDGTRRGSTDRSTVPYRCAIDVRTPWAHHGVLMGPLGPRRAPTAARQPAGGTVRLLFIGGPRFGRPAAPIGAGRGYCMAGQDLTGLKGSLDCLVSEIND